MVFIVTVPSVYSIGPCDDYMTNLLSAPKAFYSNIALSVRTSLTIRSEIAIPSTSTMSQHPLPVYHFIFHHGTYCLLITICLTY